jgi:hypothetical protein
VIVEKDKYDYERHFCQRRIENEVGADELIMAVNLHLGIDGTFRSAFVHGNVSFLLLLRFSLFALLSDGTWALLASFRYPHF